jgi:hypothetical protein
MRAHRVRIRPWGRQLPYCPHIARIRGVSERRPRDPPAQLGEWPGALGAIHPRLPTTSLQKGARQVNQGRQATNPFGVFHSPPSLLAPGWKKEGARRRRAAPGREGTGSEEPGARAGAEGKDHRRRQLHHRECLHRPEHHRHTTDDPKPATTTPPPHREHRPANLISPPPWSSSCGESVTSRRVARYSCLDAGRRAAELPCRDGWSSWAARALERCRCRARNERGLDVRRVVLRRPCSMATPSREVGRSWCWRHVAPLFAEPRENPSTRRRAARWRRAEPWDLELRPSIRDFLPFVVVRVCPGRPHPSAPRPRPRREDARRDGLRRRAVRSVWNFWKPAVEPWCFPLAGLGGRKPRVERTPALGPWFAAPPNGRCSRGVAVNRRRALHVAMSAPVDRFLAHGLPSRGMAQR